ncbi:MAG: tail fiber domain-containing protein, partial [Thermoanaerobaculia bacterium]
HAYRGSTFVGLNAGNLTMLPSAFLNTGIGTFALYSNTSGNYNTADGADALYFNTTGGNNTAAGYFALYHNIGGSDNTAIGNATLQNNATGGANTAVGSLALGAGTGGTNNTAAGFSALYANNADYNTANGSYALTTNSSGSYNVASGFQALKNNTTGLENTALGSSTLFQNIGGNDNTAVGLNALGTNTAGGFNVALGYNAGLLTTGNRNIVIGNSGVASEDDTIRIGNTQSQTFIAGIVSANVSGVPVLVSANGQLGTAASSRRYKFDISDMAGVTSDLMRLRPVTFRYFAQGDNAPLQYGLIAEEVAEVYPELVARNQDGEVETVMYQFLAPMLLNEVQKQRRQIEEQQKTINTMKDKEKTIDALNATLRDLVRRVQTLENARQ